MSTDTASTATEDRRARTTRDRYDEDEHALRLLDAWARLPTEHADRRTGRTRVIVAFLPLADRLARRYSHRQQDLPDLVQVARTALIGVVDHYDPAYGSSFYAYAVPTIRGSLKRHFRDTGWAIQPPRRLQELTLAVKHGRELLTHRLRRSPTVAELADETGAGVEDVLAALTAADRYQLPSLQETVGERDGGGVCALADTIGRTDPALEGAADRLSLPAALRRLTERERTIIGLRFAAECTQTQIAAHIGVSQMQVSRLLRAALARMRAFLDGADMPDPVAERRGIRTERRDTTAERRGPTHYGGGTAPERRGTPADRHGATGTRRGDQAGRLNARRAA